jgi:hypothetical protein
VLPPAVAGTRRPRVRWTALLVVLALAVTPTTALAQSRSSAEVQSELQREQQRARQLGEQLGEVRGEIATVEVELAEIGARLTDARGRLRVAEGQVALGELALDEAEREQVRAERAHDRAEVALARTEAELAAEEAVLVDQIVESFKYGTVGCHPWGDAARGPAAGGGPELVRGRDEAAPGRRARPGATVQRVFALRDERIERSDDAARARAQAVKAAADAATALRHLQQVRTRRRP